MIRQIFYVFDPLCGWCYGFSPQLWEFYLQHRDRYEFVPIVGGMVTGARVGPASAMYEYLRHAIPRLEATTGCKIGDQYMSMLQSDQVIFDSVPPSKAVVAFRSMKPDSSLAFVKALQHAHFYFGHDYNEDRLYQSILPQFELDPQVFFSSMESKEVSDRMMQDFDWVSQARIKGFPCLIVNIDNQLTMLSSGYTTLEKLNETLRAVEA